MLHTPAKFSSSDPVRSSAHEPGGRNAKAQQFAVSDQPVTLPSGLRKHSGNLPDDLHERQEVEHKAACVSQHIDDCMSKAQDSLHLESQLAAIEQAYGLEHIELANAGTPEACVRFKVNPVYEKHIVNQNAAYRMLGTTNDTTQTNVLFKPGTITVNNVTAQVGREMIANPISQDHLQGSESTQDSAQDNLMSQLPNAGVKKISNHLKYIKGHLLNGDIGGPGHAMNLYPITADANAKHLAFVEKFVKSSVAAGYVVYYHVKVTGENIVNTNEVNADFEFDFFRYNIHGKPVNNSRHTGSVQSRYAQVGSEPYALDDEFDKEYDKLNKGKGTPKAQALGDEATLELMGYSLEHGGSGNITEAVNNSNKALPTVYGGAKHMLMDGVSGKAGYGGTVESFNGRFLIEVDNSESQFEKGWYWVKLLHADHYDEINTGQRWLMKKSHLSKGKTVEEGTPFTCPLKISHDPNGQVERFNNGAFFVTASMTEGAWTRVMIKHSFDHNLADGAMGWMKTSWLKSS